MHRASIRVKIMLDRARANPKIRFLTNTVVEDITTSKGHVSGVKLRDTRPAKSGTKTSAVSSWPSVIPNTAVFKGQIDTDPDGYILSKGGAKTNVTGVFHAGDVQDRTYRQAVTAAGMGCMAAIEVERFLEAEGH